MVGADSRDVAVAADGDRLQISLRVPRVRPRSSSRRPCREAAAPGGSFSGRRLGRTIGRPPRHDQLAAALESARLHGGRFAGEQTAGSAHVSRCPSRWIRAIRFPSSAAADAFTLVGRARACGRRNATRQAIDPALTRILVVGGGVRSSYSAGASFRATACRRPHTRSAACPDGDGRYDSSLIDLILAVRLRWLTSRQPYPPCRLLGLRPRPEQARERRARHRGERIP